MESGLIGVLIGAILLLVAEVAALRREVKGLLKVIDKLTGKGD